MTQFQGQNHGIMQKLKRKSYNIKKNNNNNPTQTLNIATCKESA